MKNRKKLLIIAISSLAILAGTIAALEYIGVTNFIPNNGPTLLQEAEQRKADQQSKKDFIESTDQDGNTNKDDSPGGSDPNTPTSSDTIELSANKTSSAVVTVYSKLHGYSSGSCEVEIKNGTSSYTKTASIIYQDIYSTCAGYDIPVEEVGTGLWDITLRVTPSGGSSVTKTISHEVK